MEDSTASCSTDDIDQHLKGHQRHEVLRARSHGTPLSEPDQIAVEVPVALEYNGLSHAVMLATPLDLEDLIYGFSFTEGIIRTVSDIYDVDIIEQDAGIVIRADIASACVRQLKLRRRQLAGRTGCGLCGIESLTDVRRTLTPVLRNAAPLPYGTLLTAARSLLNRQSLRQLTGATHATGWADRSGQILCVREDVGRHNALDKLIGAMLRERADLSDGMAMISSRASFEMVQKAAAAGISIVAAVSAPTSYAIRVADELNILLAGFVRDDHFTVYTHAQHLVQYGETDE